MERIRIVLFFWTVTGLLSLGGCQKQVESSDLDLRMYQGRVIYHFKYYTGVIRRSLPALREVHITPYRRGRQHGTAVVKNFEGKVISKRIYVNGIKDGVHRTWYANGNYRSYTVFKKGKYVNEVWQWHLNGKLAKYRLYNEKHEVVVEKRWRNSGQVYANMVFIKGVAVGMPGSKLCEPVKPRGREVRK